MEQSQSFRNQLHIHSQGDLVKAGKGSEGMGTSFNMGALIGSVTSVFPYNHRIQDYLRATNREGIASLANSYKDLLSSDASAQYNQLIELNLSQLWYIIVYYTKLTRQAAPNSSSEQGRSQKLES